MSRRLLTPLRATVLLVLAAAATAAAAASANGVPAVAIVGSPDAPGVSRLAPVDPATLRLRPGGVALDGHGQGWSFSADGRRLAVGRENGSCVGGTTTLRLVDARRMRALGDAPLLRSGSVLATAWAGPSRVLAVVGLTDCIESTGRVAVLAVDAGKRRVVSRMRLSGEVVAVARRPGGVVLLLAPAGRIGTARLATVDAGGLVRTVPLPEIRAGSESGTQEAPTFRFVRPGLAVDPAGGRAFVVPAGDRLAEVDLATLGVRMHDLELRRSTFARFVRWLSPTANAKMVNGPERQAVWLGDGFLAVTGIDQVSTGNHVSTAAGLRLVETSDWRYRVLSPKVSRIRLAGDVLLATGSSWDGSRESGAGLVAYSRSGDVRWRLLGADVPAWVLGVSGGRGFVQVPRGRDVATIPFRLRDGRHGRPVATPRYELLSGRAAGF